ncbi:MAG: methyltransferase [candidate division WOR-3 bacterium]
MSVLKTKPSFGRFVWTVLVTLYSLIFFQNLLQDTLGDIGLIQRVFSALFVMWFGIEYYFGSPFFQSGLIAHSAFWRGLFASFVYPYIGYAGGDFIWWHLTQMPVPGFVSGVTGLIVFAIGTGIRLYTLLAAIRMLRSNPMGRDGSQQKETSVLCKRVVRLSPQQWCRHPRYLATLIQLVGIALVFRSWGGLVLVLAVGIPLVFLQARYEDSVLRNLLGADFEAYRKKVPFLLPRWR